MTDAGTVQRLDWALLSVSLVFVCLRLYVQIFRLRAFSTIDILVITAWFCFLGDVLLDHYVSHWGFWNPLIRYSADGSLPDFDTLIPHKSDMINGFKLMYGTQPVYFIELYGIKVAFVLLYYRWFPISMVKLRRALHFTFAFVVLSGLASIFINMLWCIPIKRNWSMDPEDRCLAWASVPAYYFYTILHVLTDIPVYILPFFLLPSIYPTVSRSKLTGIAFVFSIGLLSIICTVCRIILAGANAAPTTIAVWFTAEQGCAIVAICCAPLRWLWTYEYSRTVRRRSRSRNRSESIRVVVGKVKNAGGYFSRSGSNSTRGGGGGKQDFIGGGAGGMLGEGRTDIVPATVNMTGDGSSVDTHRWFEGSSRGGSLMGSIHSTFRGLGLPRRPSGSAAAAATVVDIEKSAGGVSMPLTSMSKDDSRTSIRPVSQQSNSNNNFLAPPPPAVTRQKREKRWFRKTKAALKKPSVTTTFGAAMADTRVTNLDMVAEEEYNNEPARSPTQAALHPPARHRDNVVIARSGSPAHEGFGFLSASSVTATTADDNVSGSRGSFESFTFGRHV